MFEAHTFVHTLTTALFATAHLVRGQSLPLPSIIWPSSLLLESAAYLFLNDSGKIAEQGIWALRLLVDLYSAHNLRDDGGIRPSQIRQEFERKVVGQFSSYTLWAFKPKNHWVMFRDVLKIHKTRNKATPEADHPFWGSHRALTDTGLLTYVPHIWDNDPGMEEMAAG